MTNFKETKEINLRLIISFAFILAIYLPFYVSLFFKFDPVNFTICWIGYRSGGFLFLLSYGLISGIFLFYQITLFARLNDFKNKLFIILPLIAAVFFMATVFTPIRETDPLFILKLHNLFGALSAFFSILSVTFSVFMYCMRSKAGCGKLAVVYCLVCVLAAVCFYKIGNKAVLQVGISLAFLTFTCFINLISAINEKKSRQAVDGVVVTVV